MDFHETFSLAAVSIALKTSVKFVFRALLWALTAFRTERFGVGRHPATQAILDNTDHEFICNRLGRAFTMRTTGVHCRVFLFYNRPNFDRMKT